MNGSKNNLKGIPILLTAALIWGLAFVAQTKASETLSAFTYSAIRYFLGAAALIPVALIFEKTGDKTRRDNTFKYGLITGLVLTCAMTLQQFGISLSMNSGKAGFLTAMYILIVPLFGIFLKRYPTPLIWLAIALGICGVYLLSVQETSSIELGDVLLFASAFFWSAHILIIDKVSTDIYPIRFSIMQFMTTAVISGIGMFIFDDVSVPALLDSWLVILYGGLGSVAIGYTLQVIGQKYTDPVPASLAMSMESVFSALSGAVILHERLPLKGYIGCAMIFAGIILAQIPTKKKKGIGKE